jgi:hypothetical protein
MTQAREAPNEAQGSQKLVFRRKVSSWLLDIPCMHTLHLNLCHSPGPEVLS